MSSKRYAPSLPSRNVMDAYQGGFIIAARLTDKAATVSGLVRQVSRWRRATVGVRRAAHAVGDLWRATGQRSLLSDLVLVRSVRADNADRTEAVRRFARKHATPGAVFYLDRWQLLKEPFRQWQGDRPWLSAWEDLVQARVIEAASELSADTLLYDVWPSLRRRLRSTIERDLLGRTLDTSAPILVRDEAATRASNAGEEDVTSRLDLAVALNRLRPRDRETLLRYYDASPNERRALAASLCISREALRQRVAEARRKIRNSMS